MKNLFLLYLLIDAYLGLVLAKFQVIAAVFEREIGYYLEHECINKIGIYSSVIREFIKKFIG